MIIIILIFFVFNYYYALRASIILVYDGASKGFKLKLLLSWPLLGLGKVVILGFLLYLVDHLNVVSIET